jgi:nitrilase
LGFCAIVPPGQIIGGFVKDGEGDVIADLDFAEIDARKRFMDARVITAVPNCSAC